MSLGKDNEKYEFEVNGTLIVIPGFDFHTVGRDKGMCTVKSFFNVSDGCFFKGNQEADKTTAPTWEAPAYTATGKAITTIQPVPKFFIKSRSYHLSENLRMNYGASFTTPSGLSMNWEGEGGGFLDDVSIAMLELNPVISLGWRDFIAIGGGFRAIYTFGSFNNTLYVPMDFKGDTTTGNTYGTTEVSQTSNGSAWGFGWNAAASIRPFAFTSSEILKSLTISATYRSNVHWDMKGKLYANSIIYALGKQHTIGMDADLTLYSDLPPILNVAISQDFGRNRIEFVYERTFYGSARIFEFGYANQVFDLSSLGILAGSVPIEGMINAADYSAVAYGNGWKDASAYRLGYTYFGNTWKVMASVAYDMTPAPQGVFGIPDANAYMVGFGGRKRLLNNKLDIGFGYSLALKDNRKSFIVSHDGFGQLHLFTIGLKYLWGGNG
ncbi:hypothetical protein CQA53_01315 [Helicobacter didelphidarum]|uniref:Transporter n=2 Tax=Helicobacter didelphidarum TaxID=2040648 RepID=A0A3D8IQT9_9HELI|nr:hypothetical protein CQA53_01315 [Helicobacter didelphidarum]